MTAIEQCEGYKTLLAAAQADEEKSPDFHDYFAKVRWVVERAQHYAEKTGMPATDILDAWEKQRSYWYMNYYQDANQPEIKGDKVRIFETRDDYLTAVSDLGFRCPRCGGVSTDPFKCDSGAIIEYHDGDGPCDWKAWGLLGTLGAGVYIFIKDHAIIVQIFMPIAFEQEKANAGAA